MVRLISIGVFGCLDVSFFQYFIGCISVFNLIDKLYIKNTFLDMGKFIARWTGASLGQVQCINI